MSKITMSFIEDTILKGGTLPKEILYSEREGDSQFVVDVHFPYETFMKAFRPSSPRCFVAGTVERNVHYPRILNRAVERFSASDESDSLDAVSRLVKDWEGFFAAFCEAVSFMDAVPYPGEPTASTVVFHAMVDTMQRRYSRKL